MGKKADLAIEFLGKGGCLGKFMVFTLRRYIRLVIVLTSLSLAFMLTSCKSPEKYKDEADKETYKIIDQKWQDSFGTKANYIVSDAEPNRVDINSMIPEDGVLNLQRAVEIATKFSRDYQTQKESLYTSALGLSLTRYNYAVQWLGTVDVQYARSYNTTTKVEEDVTASGTLEASKNTLIGDGIQVSTALALDWSRFLTGSPQDALSSILTGNLAIPLLGATAGKQAREALTQAERNVLYQVRSFNRFRQTFVTSLVSAYYNVLLQKQSLAISEISYQRLLDAARQLEMEVEVNRRPQSDADENRQNLLSRESQLVSSRTNYQLALDNFKIRLAIPTTAAITLDQNDLIAIQQIAITDPEYTEDEAFQIALNQRLDFANTRDGLEDSERQLKLAAEGLGVQLELDGSMNASSPSDVQNPADIRLHRGRYNLGLAADLPFSRVAERNAYRRSLISFEQRNRSYVDAVDNLRLTVRQAYRDLRQNAENYRIQKIGLELAEKRLDREKLLIEVGQGTVRQLLLADDSIVSAQNSVYSALVSHMTTKLNFFSNIGVLQVKPDGMWEQEK
jgi:outer membrane protein TolC